ncbi:MAG: ATP-binding protein [Planctomycetota bacterium]
MIVPSSIRFLGQCELQPPIEPRTSDFLRGAHVLRRVRVRGVVQFEARGGKLGWMYSVETGAGSFLLPAPDLPKFSPERLLDSEVEVTGVAGVSRNWRSQFIRPRVMIADASDIEIVKPAPDDPFQLEEISISEIDGYSARGRNLHRVRVEGVVTYYDSDRLIYIQRGSQGVRVQLSSTVNVDVGDQVDVAGFIDTTRYLRGLRGAVVRVTGEEHSLSPIPVTISNAIEDHYRIPIWKMNHTETVDGRLVQVQGHVRSFQHRFGVGSTRIELETDEFLVDVTAPIGARVPEPGAEVRLTGVAEIRYSYPNLKENLATPEGMRLLLRDESDIIVVQPPPWWTARRIAGALAVTVVLALAILSWAFILKRQVRRQTHDLANEMRSRRDAVIEYQAAIHERTRLAANLHDTVLQTMAGAAYQIQACGPNLAEVAPERSSHLETAQKMIQRGQEDIRNAVWALHCLPPEEGRFADSVEQLAERVSGSGRARIQVHATKEFPSLADFIAGNLLLVIQEATLNAIKHAEPTSIEISLDWEDHDACVVVRVADDGQGFDMAARPTSSDGHFGIESMGQRIERLGGSLSIQSSPGLGTKVTVAVPLKDFDEELR